MLVERQQRRRIRADPEECRMRQRQLTGVAGDQVQSQCQQNMQQAQYRNVQIIIFQAELRKSQRRRHRQNYAHLFNRYPLLHLYTFSIWLRPNRPAGLTINTAMRIKKVTISL